MSCGCGTFSSQKDTWSCKSDLKAANWDPYPELQNPKNCYGIKTVTENYRAQYKIEQNKIDANYSPLQKSVIFSTTPIKEGYSRPTSYNILNDTWGQQKPYDL